MEFRSIGQEIYQLIENLYPICRSVTGDGFRNSLKILQQHVPLIMHEVPTGTPVFDWTVPKEWNIRDAYIKNSAGEKIVDFRKSNLHVLNYSIPINRRVHISELKEHLYSIPEQKDLIPYRTSYYKENWGFCITHELFEAIDESFYDVSIDSSLEDGYLTYGEYYIKGEIEDEFLLSCHSCHPSLCNDNLSGMGVATYLAKLMGEKNNRYSYRFLFIPGTIGSITWLSVNKDSASKIKHGLVIAGVGDPGKMHYKKSRRGDAEIDQAVNHVLKHSGQEYEILDFSPYGYDERQYCSPGFNLPIGSLTRTPYGQYPEYHTSADNLDFIQIDSLNDSLSTYMEVINIIEQNRCFQNTNPYCEPQLGKRGLYGMFGGKKNTSSYELAMLWVLNNSDGQITLLDIADKAGIPFNIIYNSALALKGSGLLVEV